MSDLDSIASRHGVPSDAARHLLDAIARGGGRMAQFDHPALGGLGQWHAGGGLMIGDMFNDALKARVAALCDDLRPLVAESDSPGASPSAWWPSDFGRPSASGSQNEARYALFPAARRLAIEADGQTTIYDTGDHLIEGVSQQQSRGRDLSFTSQTGTVRLNDLAVVDAPGGRTAPPAETPAPAAPEVAASRSSDPESSVAPAAPQASARPDGDVLTTLERLAELHRKGVLTDTEFAAKKADLLTRL